MGLGIASSSAAPGVRVRVRVRVRDSVELGGTKQALAPRALVGDDRKLA